MELFIIIALHLLMTVQSSEYPKMKVSPDVLRESNSVHLNCERPAYVRVIQCYFYANGEKYKDIKLSPSCDLSLTGAEVLLWTGLKSPGSLDIACYYTTDVKGILKPSAHSPPVTLTILGDLIKPIMSVDNSSNQISITCEIPESVRTDVTCNLYTEDGPLRHRSHSHRTQSGEQYCVFHISLSEIFTYKQTVNSRHLSCDYSVRTDPEMNLTSPRSDLSTIRGFPQAVLIVSSSVITDTDTLQMNCMNRENQKMDTCFFTVDKSRMQEERSCHLSLTGFDIIHWSGGQRSSVNITCFYRGLISSPHSDPVTVTVQTGPQTTRDSAAISQEMWIKILSGAFCSVFVLTGLICLCRCLCKNRKKRQGTAGETCASGPEESFSMITSVPDTSQQTGLKHPQSLQDSKSGPLLNTLFKPTDPLDNTQQKMGCTEDNENVHHMYCTIPDKPVNITAGGQNYSLAF